MIRRILALTHTDRVITLGVITKVWEIGSGPVTLLIITRYFTPEVQGYYFTFGSLLALQVFAELGLGQVIVQFASHEWARLRLGENGQIEGDEPEKSHLLSLGRLAFRWYARAAVLAALALGFGGYLFFSRSGSEAVQWAAPWTALCILAGINLCLLPLWSLLEGCHQLGPLYAARLVQGILYSLSIWLGVMLGAKLWTGVITLAVVVTWGAVFLWWRYRHFFRSFFVPIARHAIDWRNEVWPMQWRIALSSVSSYFVFSFFTPVMFRLAGAEEAGRVGMTWSLVVSVSTLSSVWIKAQAPRFGALIARKQYRELDHLALRAGLMAACVAVVASVAVEGLVWFLYSSKHQFAERILPPLPTALFLLATILLQISYAQAAYLRAHKKEPFLIIAVLQAILIGGAVILLGRAYGAAGMAAGFLAVVLCVSIPLGTWIFYHYRAAWHAP